jgi:phosphotransferase system enzyme I (PtsI)
MYPMVSSVTEIKKANQILEECKKELSENEIEYGNPEVGIMIEIPAAVMMADKMAKEVDFFSIGTNDLIQYTVAVDRVNEKIAEMHTPYHPGVLRLINRTIELGHQEGIWVGMCGEAAGDELLLPFLLGAGLDEFSMSAVSLLKIKELLSKWEIDGAKEVTEKLLQMEDSEQVKKFLKKIYRIE